MDVEDQVAITELIVWKVDAEWTCGRICGRVDAPCGREECGCPRYGTEIVSVFAIWRGVQYVSKPRR